MIEFFCQALESHNPIKFCQVSLQREGRRLAQVLHCHPNTTGLELVYVHVQMQSARTKANPYAAHKILLCIATLDLIKSQVRIHPQQVTSLKERLRMKLAFSQSFSFY